MDTKMSAEEFADKLLEILEPILADLPPEEQDARIEAFRKAVTSL